MSRFISCLRHGMVIGTKSESIASRSFAALTQHRVVSLLDSSNSNGQIFATNQGHRNLSSINLTSCRNLYTENGLGMSKLDRLRARKEQMFIGEGAKERYMERLSGYIQAGDRQSVLKDDLINLVGIASDEKDLDLLESIIASAGAEQPEFYEGWGTTVMRLYCKMHQVDRAMNNIKDIERFGQFFNLRSCYKVLMAMLYDAQRYEDVLKVLEFSQEHLKNEPNERTEDDFPSSDRDLAMIAFASMAKLGGEEQLKRAEALMSKLRQTTKHVGLRPTSFVAYLAVTNNQPKLALNLISVVPTRTYITLRELKIIALIQLGRHDDILLHLRDYVSNIRRDSNLLLQSTYDKIMNSKDEIKDSAMRQELEDILAEIKEGGHVSTATLEEILFKPIDNEKPPMRFDSRFPGNDMRQGGGYQGGNNDRYPPRGPRDQYGGNQYGGNQYRGNQYGNNQYRNNQYNSGDRFQRRNNFEQNDEDAEPTTRGGGRRQQGRFNYQSMNLD